MARRQGISQNYQISLAEIVTFSCLFFDSLDNGPKMEYTIIIRNIMTVTFPEKKQKGAALC